MFRVPACSAERGSPRVLPRECEVTWTSAYHLIHLGRKRPVKIPSQAATVSTSTVHNAVSCVERSGSSVYCAASSQPLVLLHSPLVDNQRKRRKSMTANIRKHMKLKKKPMQSICKKKVQRQVITFSVVPKPAKRSQAVLVSSSPPPHRHFTLYFEISTPPVAPRAGRKLVGCMQMGVNQLHIPFLMSP